MDSRNDLPTSISVNNIQLGTQAFDGLDRRIKAVTGGREQVFDYEPGQTQPSSVTMASGEVIEYAYVPQLGSEPVLRRLPRIGLKGEVDEAMYEYDTKNARLVFCQEQDIALTREYYSTGEPKREKRTVAQGEYTMDYRYSRLGRLLGYTDVLRQEQTYRYNADGRLVHTQLGTTSSTFTYDLLGRPETITTSDTGSGQSVGIRLEYDEFDRETLREFDLDGVKQQMTQKYNDVDGLALRTLKEGTVVLRDETYGYDLRGRLTTYNCVGTQRPVDPYGKTITGQVFSFSPVDNLQLVLTTFDGGSNRAIYTYDTVDPTQLRKVVNTHVDYPAEILLDYNADGHLIRDEANRTLEYDALGRLISVSALPGETPGSYHYDPLDTLAGVNDGGGQEQRFYQDGSLANQIKGANSSTFIRGEDVVLAELKAGADPKSLLLASDIKSSVLAEVSRAGRKEVAYSPYGHRANDPSVSSQLSYNGERREGQTGRYLLGNGYRAFSPVLMRFNSPDSWSPFGEGGVNAYAYCYGNPIMYSDETGHAPMFDGWMSSIMRLISRSTARVKRFFTDVPDSRNFTKASSKVFPNAKKGDVPFVKTANGISRDNPLYQSNTSANNVVSEHFDFLNRYGSGSSSGSASSTRSSVSSHVYEQIKPSLTVKSANPSVRPSEPPPRNVSVKKPGNVRSEVNSEPPASRKIESFRDDAWHRKHDAKVRSRDKFGFDY